MLMVLAGKRASMLSLAQPISEVDGQASAPAFSRAGGSLGKVTLAAHTVSYITHDIFK